MAPIYCVAFVRNQTYTDYAQEAWKADAGSQLPFRASGVSIRGRGVPFPGNVNRMEGFSFMAGADA